MQQEIFQEGDREEGVGRVEAYQVGGGQKGLNLQGGF